MNDQTTVSEMLPGTTIRNGATVIAASARNAGEWVLLCMRPVSLVYDDPYVTWVCSRPGNGSDTYAGHYFSDLREAVEDFYTR